MKFIDLFAGIGGFRLGFEQSGGWECVFTSEWNKYARMTYSANFNIDHPFIGDINSVAPEEVPDHDVLLAGFPCQPFSVAGTKGGFEDEKGRGNLFFNIATILKAKKPRFFVLENVKHLKSHDKGNTIRVILNELQQLGYFVTYQVLNSRIHGGVPQNRERIYLVGFLNGDEFMRFSFPDPIPMKPVSEILEDETDVDKKYWCTDLKYNRISEMNLKVGGVYSRATGNKVVSSSKGVVPCLMTSRFNHPFLYQVGYSRNLTPREWARLHAYPDNFVIPVSKSEAYKQFGNTVTVSIVKRIADQIKIAIEDKS